MTRNIRKLLCYLCILTGVFPAIAGEHTSLLISYAKFDIFRQTHYSSEARVELRQDIRSSVLHPLAGVMGNVQGARFYYLGLYMDLKLIDGLYITPSFAPGIYSKGRSKNLHFFIEFRSQLDISVKVSDFYRMGMNINHMSNASLSKLNPGVESIAFYILFPFPSIF